MSNEAPRCVKLHIPKPPKPEFSITIVRGGKPIGCTLILEEPPKFCSLTKDSDVLFHIYLNEVIFPLEIVENTVKLTKNVAISFTNQRYTRLFATLTQQIFCDGKDKGENCHEEREVDSKNITEERTTLKSENTNSQYPSFQSFENNLDKLGSYPEEREHTPRRRRANAVKILSNSPAIGDRGGFHIDEGENMDNIEHSNISIHIFGALESDSALSFNEIRSRNDMMLVIIKIEWRLSNKIGNDTEFDQVITTNSSLKLDKFMIGRFVKLTILWSDKANAWKNETKLYKQSAVKGPIVPCQVLARSILIHSLTDAITFNVMLRNEANKPGMKSKFAAAVLLFDQNNILIGLNHAPKPLFVYPVEDVLVSLNDIKLSLCNRGDKKRIVNLHMNNEEIAILLFHVIIFRKFLEKYKTIAQWESDLSVGLYSDFNRIYSKILRTEEFLINS